MLSLKLGLEIMQVTMMDKASETVSSDKPFPLGQVRHFVMAASKAVNTMELNAWNWEGM